MRNLPSYWISLALICACGADPPRPPQTPGAAPPVASEPPTPPEKAGDVPTRSNIAIAVEISKACGIADADAHFAFDSANVSARDQAILHNLAACFVTGPLMGRHMLLVGHADPRGDAEYNMVLGGRRSDNVKSAMAGAGMAASVIATSSRGKMDATGTDEAGWENDRRVDVMLGS